MIFLEMVLSAEKRLHVITLDGLWGSWEGAVQCFHFPECQQNSSNLRTHKKAWKLSIPSLLLGRALISPQKQCLYCKNQSNFARGWGGRQWNNPRKINYSWL